MTTPAARGSREGEIKCEVLDASYIEECALVMAKAFVDSPSYRYILQDMLDPQARVDALQWLFSRNLQLVLCYKKSRSALRGVLLSPDQQPGSHSSTEKAAVACCFLWLPEADSRLSIVELLWAGLWQVPFRFGHSTFRRLTTVLDDFQKQAVAQSKSPNRKIRLERMVVHPDHQGKGWGSEALRQTIQQEEEETQVDIFTQEARNVRFYQRLGFKIVNEKAFYENDEKFGFTNYSLALTIPSIPSNN